MRLARVIPQWAWAFSLYVGIAIATIGRGAVLHPASVCACSNSAPDPTIFMWSLAWWPHAIAQGLNPFVANVIAPPGGANVAAGTTIPAAAIAMWPVTALFGPFVSFNVLAILGPPLCGLTAYLLCRRLSAHNSASLTGGFLFGFSSYELSQSLGHTHLTLVFLIPVMVHLALRRFAGELSRRRFIAVLATVFVFQALLSTEILFDAVLIGASSLVIAYYCFPRSTRGSIDTLAREIAIAGIAALLLLLPYFWAALAEAPITRGGNTFGLDALNLVLPTRITWLGGQLLHSVSATFERGNNWEAGGYLSLPLLIALGVFTRTTWRTERTTRLLVYTFAVSVVLALGSPLHVAGHQLIALPWSLLQELPLFPGLVPSRIMVFAELILAVCVAIWLSRPSLHSGRRWLIASLGVVALFPNVAGAWWSSRPTNPSFFRTTEYRHRLAHGENVLIIPAGMFGNSMLWQAETDFYFTMPDGYVPAVNAVAPQDVQATVAIYAGSIRGAHIETSAAPVIQAFLHEHRIHHIIIEPRYQQAWSTVLDRIATRPQRLGGILLYTVKGSS